MREFANVQTEVRADFLGLPAGWLQQRAAEVCLAMAFSPVLAWMRPFGVDEQTFLARMGYWAGVLACWFVVCAVVDTLLAERRLSRDLAPAARRAVVIVLTALPMLLIVGPATHVLEGWQASAPKIAELYLKIIVTGTAVELLAKQLLSRRGYATAMALPARSELPIAAPAADDLPMTSSALVARLPLEIRGRILCLEMEDHYVRVHTDRGSALLLMRLSDAIAEAHPVPGRQVHRSWWVSDEAVQGFERVGRVGAVRLSNGARAPVSQRYLKSVEASFA